MEIEWPENDKFKEECGVVAVYGHPEAANLAYLGLYALQHRGQESAGIISSDGRQMYREVGMGLVADIFSTKRIKRLPGNMALGHNRYSTTGDSKIMNAQPCLINYVKGSLALGHNGNLVNASMIREALVEEGAIFQSTNDSEVIVHLIAHSHADTFVERVVEALLAVNGAYSLAMMTENEIVAARDPYGFRPLCLGQLDGAYVVSSESCVMDLIEAKYIREVEPGEVLLINENGLSSFFPFRRMESKRCIFEHIYFARPDSFIFGEHVYAVRKRLGKALARQAPVEADIVVPVPDSGNISALGYAEQAGIPYEMGLIRNHYVGRTFIEPKSQIRHFGVKVKLNAVKEIIDGKRVVIIDDSIVRGTTSRKIVKMVREAGAKEVHVRISSPPTLYPCFYGIDTPDREELIASKHTLEETRRYITADSLDYLEIDNMMKTVDDDPSSFCAACFDGNYAVPVDGKGPQPIQLNLFGSETKEV
ncbi:MAG: amidophosphoribosyltransferase [Nitrospinaceae bacterium]|nr:amidophosphoribosyltransferase [Nitrospinaceae bacterium]NIR56077.1 amidophosphoribosyltransferase [Nitrospinaceae bacterium]NIS86522.1 amidophosphoribosyltransferase [Nitrospinaceae bacterium]NIT83360.1 amidophosphoribosyltransferase [Nitrospinaceae bacterium]NIU45566.1 amidophosphoribosyltransferase [Nitrospinaceae bacterium]